MPATRRRGVHEAPDTEDAFRRLAALAPGPERDRVRQEIIEAWLPMAERISRRFRNKGEQASDLQQVAAVALVKAVDGYDPELGHAFPSYAVPTITGELKRHFRDCVWSVHIPRRAQELRRIVRTARGSLEQTLGGAVPTVAQLAVETGLSEDDVCLGLEAESVHRTMPLDAPAGDQHETPLADLLGAPDDAMELCTDLVSLRPLLAALPDRERRVLYLRFFEELSQQQIGLRVGLSQMHVCRILRRTLAELRENLLLPA
ncbi:SigB/SigF/SigG family RNA polymerase sigma factor [Streptomyces sp. NPDC059740]|uniref:SigB/SigF/SigG family RNA polymerase sigma factor n=1 Tax=Streptomyces sp. NPDC059740 TaxID=3346926 RepID=UPI0036526681